MFDPNTYRELFHLMDAWPRCLERLEAELPAEDVHTWLKPLQAEQRSNAMVLYAPNAFIVEQVRERYLGRIRELLDYFAGHDDVSLEIGSRSKPVDINAPVATGHGAVGVAAPAEPFAGNMDLHYTFDNFVEGRSNQLGRAAAWQAACDRFRAGLAGQADLVSQLQAFTAGKVGDRR